VGKSMRPSTRHPWMTMNEAAAYLRWSRDTVERHMVEGAEPVQGMLRFVRLRTAGHHRRVLAEDVYRILPQRAAMVEAVSLNSYA